MAEPLDGVVVLNVDDAFCEAHDVRRQDISGFEIFVEVGCAPCITFELIDHDGSDGPHLDPEMDDVAWQQVSSVLRRWPVLNPKDGA